LAKKYFTGGESFETLATMGEIRIEHQVGIAR
jgi:hypothetical protein